MTRGRNRLLALVGVTALVGLFVGGIGGAAAQPSETAKPAQVHKGSCAQLDPNPAYPLNAVGKDKGTPAAGEAMKGAQSAIQAERSATIIHVSLDELLKAPFAINVHLSTKDIKTYIACGDIGGQPSGPPGKANLAIGLGELNKSGYSGIAWLSEDGKGKTAVVVYLAKGLAQK